MNYWKQEVTVPWYARNCGKIANKVALAIVMKQCLLDGWVYRPRCILRGVIEQCSDCHNALTI